MHKLKSFSRCEKCNKVKAVEKEIKVGDKVDFTVSTSNGRSVRCSVKTGKVQTIGVKDYVGVVYRKKLYQVAPDNLSDSEGASSLSVALIGKCECGVK